MSYRKPLNWQDVPQEACRLAKAAAGPYQVIQDLMPSLPDIKTKVWYNPDNATVFFTYPVEIDTDKVASWHIAMKQIPGVDTVSHGYFSTPDIEEPYIQIKKALDASTIFHPIAQAAQFEPNALNRLWGGPTPLSATLGGGLLGAGLGYAGGWLAEQLLPEKRFERGILRRNMALAGGLAGAVPGLWTGLDQHFRGSEPGWKSWIKPFPWHQEKESRYTHLKSGLAKELPGEALELDAFWEKAAFSAGGDYEPIIPVDQFGRTIWNDLRSQGGYTTAPVVAATTGMLQAASMSQGGANFVSPMDIARIGIGMGSGWLSGMIVGKTLGALAGLKPETQQTLQQTGIWAGVLSNTVPMAFRG